MRIGELPLARLRVWVAAALVGAGVIAAAYLPPRGGVRARRSTLFVSQAPEPTPARRRAQALAAEWRAAERVVSLVEHRARSRGIAATTPAAWTVELLGIRPVPPAAGARVRAAMDTVWHQLGLRDTKVRVAVAIDLGLAPASPRRPTSARQPAYLEPDSTDRTTCVVLVPTSPYWKRLILGEIPGTPDARARLVPWLKAGLGPCAFYASYGAPSRSVRRWLVARGWDIALSLQPDTGDIAPRDILAFDRRFAWYWERIYTYPTATVACFAGRVAGCRSAVLEGMDDRGADDLPHVVQVDRNWWRSQRLLPGARYLSDVAREVGPERFQRFWSTSLPVDTALAAALKRPVGAWTEEWQRRFVPRVRLGAAAPPYAYPLATLLTAVAVLAVTLTASRRQVR